MNLYLDIFKFRMKIGFAIYRKRDTWTRGVLNRTEDGLYVPFFDYDMMRQEYVEGELKRFQETFDLGDILLLKSSDKGFHAISLAKVTAREYMEILRSSSVDTAFKNLPLFSSYRNWVLRGFEKGKTERPAFLKVMRAKTKRQQS